MVYRYRKAFRRKVRSKDIAFSRLVGAFDVCKDGLGSSRTSNSTIDPGKLNDAHPPSSATGHGDSMEQAHRIVTSICGYQPSRAFPARPKMRSPDSGERPIDQACIAQRKSTTTGTSASEGDMRLRVLVLGVHSVRGVFEPIGALSTALAPIDALRVDETSRTDMHLDHET